MRVVLTLTGDNQLTLKVGDHVIVKVDDDVSSILHLIHMRLSAGCDGKGLFIEDVVHDSKIMGCKIPYDVHVMLEEAQVNSDRIVIVKTPPELVLL